MKLFMQKPLIQKFDHAKEFLEAYQIGEGDFILASKRIYETYFAPLNLKARVEYKSNYGAGEPTDVMILSHPAFRKSARSASIITSVGSPAS